MDIVSTSSQLEHLESIPALLILFGGAHCGVCVAVKPKIENMLSAQFQKIRMVYVDCEKSPDICAQHGVFSLPVVKLYFNGQLSLEMARSFSIKELQSRIERIYKFWES